MIVDRGADDPLPDARDDPPVRPREADRGRRGRGARRSPLPAFAALAEAAEPELRGPAMVDWLDRMDAERRTSARRSSGASRRSRGTPSGWPRRCSRTGPSAWRRPTTTPVSWPRSRSPGPDRREPRGGSRRPGARGPLLGEAARIWAMGGQAAAALPWGRDALQLADASGDIQAEARRPQRHRRRDGVHGLAGTTSSDGSRRASRSASVRQLVAARHGCRVRRRQSGALRSGRRRATRPRGRTRPRADPAAPTPSARSRSPTAGCSAWPGTRTRRSPASGSRSPASPSSATCGWASPPRATSPTRSGEAGDSTRRSPRIATRSWDGFASVTAGPSRTSSRTSLSRDRPGPAGSRRSAARGGRGDARRRPRADGLRRGAGAGAVRRAASGDAVARGVRRRVAGRRAMSMSELSGSPAAPERRDPATLLTLTAAAAPATINRPGRPPVSGASRSCDSRRTATSRRWRRTSPH